MIVKIKPRDYNHYGSKEITVKITGSRVSLARSQKTLVPCPFKAWKLSRSLWKVNHIAIHDYIHRRGLCFEANKTITRISIKVQTTLVFIDSRESTGVSRFSQFRTSALTHSVWPLSGHLRSSCSRSIQVKPQFSPWPISLKRHYRGRSW